MYHVYHDYRSEYGTIHPSVLFRKGHNSLEKAVSVAKKRVSKLGKLYITNPSGHVIQIIGG